MAKFWVMGEAMLLETSGDKESSEARKATLR